VSKDIDFTVIGSGAKFTGDLTVAHDLRVDGVFDGKVECGGTFTVGNKGFVKGDIAAVNGEIAGKVEGNVSCSKLLELNEGASIIGDISAKELVINKGAVLHGNSSMIENAGKKSGTAKRTNSKSGNRVEVEM
jgi:cytoskeletal protein CcmA (bactofilin family)